MFHCNKLHSNVASLVEEAAEFIQRHKQGQLSGNTPKAQDFFTFLRSKISLSRPLYQAGTYNRA